VADSRLKLNADPDANPLNLVLGTNDIVTAYAEAVDMAQPKWKSMTVPQRMTFLTDFALEVLDALQIAPPVRVGGTLGSMGYFESSKWQIVLVKPLFYDHDLVSIAAQAGHVFHEFEHLSAKYVAARYLAANKASQEQIQKDLDIPGNVAKEVLAHPLPTDLMELGKACHFRVTSEKSSISPNDYYRSLHALMRRSQAEQKTAEDALAKVEAASSFSADAYKRAYARKRSADKTVAAALREYQLSETEIGSNVVENLVKSRLLRKLRGDKGT
jgi:hypothetical protein